jgi:CoA:oxalate CoA-transferase
VLENFRPKVMERLGLPYDLLAARNPRIVYCAISGFGQDGPWAARPACWNRHWQPWAGLSPIT